MNNKDKPKKPRFEKMWDFAMWIGVCGAVIYMCYGMYIVFGDIILPVIKGQVKPNLFLVLFISAAILIASYYFRKALKQINKERKSPDENTPDVKYVNFLLKYTIIITIILWLIVGIKYLLGEGN